ncbi:protein CcmA, bactofilin family [Lishizhenia tianjinensis]|uniref:Protein CcmA, bactofilin family n=1 Tax=Lishizhenia tianjinensis TaxID=477690 RepID=A0A1I7AXI5_9FLAO|nr:polymer-forming cytoskeletal protein [Lishizhenia tianjinensis]SFT79687.1 protein CcmA, bactofilin family [Lishizhenia tianjinensis]
MLKGSKNSKVVDSPDRLNRLVTGSRMEGFLKTESSLRIDGEVVGNIECAAKLVVGVEAQITGDIVAHEVEVEGKINGNVKVEDVLTLRSTALINGDMTTARLVIEDGAEFNGDCKMSGANTPSSGSSRKKKKNQEVEQEAELVY